MTKPKVELALYPIVATITPDGTLKPYTKSDVDTDAFDQYIAGTMTKVQFQHLTRMNDLMPFLGVVLHGSDGPFIYQPKHILEDIEQAVGHWNRYKQTSFTPTQELPNDTDEVSALIKDMEACMTWDSLFIEYELTVLHLESLSTDRINKLFTNPQLPVQELAKAVAR